MHLRADGPDGLAHAQGRAAAREYGWTLELRRHRAQGTSASFLGPDALSWDRFARRARLADTARRCFAALEEDDPESAAWVRAYVTGVNEGLESLRGAEGFAEGVGSWAAREFGRAGLAPGRWEPWTPLAVRLSLRMLAAGVVPVAGVAVGLPDFPDKLWREQVAERLGAEAVALFEGEGPRPGTAGRDPGPHQRVRLSCPEFDVIGLAVPGVPGVVRSGRTDTVTWTFTPAPAADDQDLYHERLRRTGAGVEALGPDGRWHRAARHTELVRVAGEGTVETEVIETGRGPVVAGGPEGLDDGTPVALSLRYPARVTADLGFGALLPLLRARRVADVDRALAAGSGPVGVVRADDIEGGALHRATGRVPVRAAANLVRPVPAWEPGHEWHGWQEPPGTRMGMGTRVGTGEGFWAGSPADGPLLDGLAALDGLTPAAAVLRDRVLRDRALGLGGPGAGGADGEAGGGAAYRAVRRAVVQRLAAEPAFAALASPPAYPEVFQPWLALAPRVAHALGRLLRAETLYGVDRTAVLRAAVEEAAAGQTPGLARVPFRE